jgi:hypothetical protein
MSEAKAMILVAAVATMAGAGVFILASWWRRRGGR